MLLPMCQMNKNFNQTAGQVAYNSYQSCVVKATDIAMEAYNNSYYFNLSTGQVTKNVASPVQNEPVIGLEDRLLLTCWLLLIIREEFLFLNLHPSSMLPLNFAYLHF